MSRGLRVCLSTPCPELVRPPATRCEQHALPARRPFANTQDRGSSTAQGYGSKWRKARLLYLAEHPWCVQCPAASTVVDHITPHRGDLELFWRPSNWQALCKRCHDRKTMSAARKRGSMGEGAGNL